MDIIPNLRKLDFPECAVKALDYFAANLDGNKPGIPGLTESTEEIYEQMANEFIFGFINKSKSKLSALEEIGVVGAILTFFLSQYSRTTMLVVYKHLFYNMSRNDVKLNFFTKVLSCAITVQNKYFLEVTATWIQLQGCQSEVVLETVRNILVDHCSCTPVTSQFKKLPSVSMLFTCHLITSITHIYSLPGQDKDALELNPLILELICDWMSYDPMVCISSLFPKYSQFLQSNQQTLWTSPTKPNTHTAIPGLVKWCTRSPFLRLPRHLQKVRLSDHEDGSAQVVASKSGKIEISDILWSRLHFLVMKTIEIFPKVPGSNLFELITLADMMKIVKVVSLSCKSLKFNAGQILPETSFDMDESTKNIINVTRSSLDRVAQILQTSLSTGAFRCSLVDLKSIFDSLSQTRLLRIIQIHHLTGLPPTMHSLLKDFE